LAINLDLSGELAIYQGANFDSLTLYYPSDVSSWTPRGQIRKTYLYQQGEVVANFDFAPLTWSQVEVNSVLVYRTVVIPSLTHTATAAIPVPRKGNWVYDIELVNPGNTKVIKLARGTVEILPEVTGV
jgi:hypothetical protein